MAVELGSGYDNPTFKTRKGIDMNVSSGDIYENFQRPEKYEQQKPKPNSDVTPKQAAALMPNLKVHLVLVSVGIVSVLLLVSIGFFSWAGWKMNQLDETVADLEKQTENLKTENEKLQNETEKLMQTIPLIIKFITYPIDENCDSKECRLCKQDWIFFNESCYFFSYVSLTWEQSRWFCQDKSADLVVVDNLQEQKFIYENMKSYYYWLGLRKVGSDWVWVDGRNDTLGFWSPSNRYFPDYSSPRPTDSYAYMYQTETQTASWVSAPDTDTLPPLCEQTAFNVSLN